MSEKDFLSQFSDSGKPESFREEERIPVQKQRKPVNKGLLAALGAVLVVLLVLSYFLFFAPKIVMPDFLGRNRTDVAAWVKQQGIEPAGIVFEETYDFDTEEGDILSQSVQAGKKVKKDVKINFTMSLGPDPDERIRVPDLESMTKDEIQDWITKNKLSKTKIMTSYHDEVEEGDVIDYSFTGADEDSFTRGSTLRINISKGPTPAGKVTVEDFEKKMFDSLEAWAKSKKINVEKTEAYSDKVEEGYIISQSVPSGRTINEGDTITVVVSKGKAVYMPNMYEWTESQINAWCAKNGVMLASVNYRYDEEGKGECIGQSIPAGRLVSSDDYLEVTISLDDANVAEFIREYGEHASYDDLYRWIKEKNAQGAHLSVSVSYELNDTVEIDHIVSMSKKTKNTDTVNVVVSDGKNIMLRDDTKNDLRWSSLSNEYEVRQLCEYSGVACQISYTKKEGLYNGDLVSITRSDDGSRPIAGTYITQRHYIKVVIADNGAAGARPDSMEPGNSGEGD